MVASETARANRDNRSPVLRSRLATPRAAAESRGMDLELPVAAAIRGPHSAPVALTVNGEAQGVELEPRTSLLDALREQLRLTGSKNGCDQGTCGACTVWVDGRRVLACLTLAIACEGREVLHAALDGQRRVESPAGAGAFVTADIPLQRVT
jgi:hypothetical protein